MLTPLLPDADAPHNIVRGLHGHLVYNRHDSVVGLSARAYGEYFESEVDIFRSCVGTGMHVAEIGANIGTHALALARLGLTLDAVAELDDVALAVARLVAGARGGALQDDGDDLFGGGERHRHEEREHARGVCPRGRARVKATTLTPRPAHGT